MRSHWSRVGPNPIRLVSLLRGAFPWTCSQGGCCMSMNRWGGFYKARSAKDGAPREQGRGPSQSVPQSPTRSRLSRTWTGSAGLQGRDSKCVLLKLPGR